MPPTLAYGKVCDDAVIAHGGELVQPIGADAPEATARFRDPGRNILGLYQDPRRSTASGNAG